MGCFSLPVRRVSSTRIFARPLHDHRQLLVYGVTLELWQDVAMVLPIPVPEGSPETAVRFVDLSMCPGFFHELDALFRDVNLSASGAFGTLARRPEPQASLAVHEVGELDASYVPSLRDFERLDPRFRLSDEVWEQLPRYRDWGFCVFKLKLRKKGSGVLGLFKGWPEVETRKVHPVAFEFPRRDPTTLFYPTVHVHDGAVHPTAEFDHQLYCQPDAAWEPLMDWERSTTPADANLDAMVSGAVRWLEPGGWLYKRSLEGELPNRDIYLAESKLRARTAVSELFRVRMRATWEHVVDDGKTALDPRVKKWKRVSEAERVRIRDAVSKELAPIFAARAEAWALRPFTHDDPDLAVFAASNERIEPQEVHVAFERTPSKEVWEAVQTAVQGAFDRASV